ncbi:MAG: archease [Gammaproteobacteria bacterium]|nr:archease [Gammaproteobacteria bacterium]
MSTHWAHFEHDADIGVRGIAPTLEGAFEQAALALTAVVTEPAGVASVQGVRVHCSAPDTALLLVDFLNAIVFQMATRHLLFGRFEIQQLSHREDGQWVLDARLCGEAVEPERHQPAVEVKGATYTSLEVKRQVGGDWLAQCVVDV